MKHQENQHPSETLFNLIMSLTGMNEVEDNLSKEELEQIEEDASLITEKVERMLSDDDDDQGVVINCR